jgi:hypothetical protein
MLAGGAFLLDQRLDMGVLLEDRELQIGGAGTTDPRRGANLGAIAASDRYGVRFKAIIPEKPNRVR